MSTEGILLVDKPAGLTSAKVVAKIKKKFSLKKVGHAGTLDPAATGLLVLLCGKATKLQAQFLNGDKAYEGVIRLGVETETNDLEGALVRKMDTSGLFATKTSKDLASDLQTAFLGEQQQIPPKFSAIKVNGKRAYKLARKGEKVEIKARSISIDELELKFVDEQRLEFKMRCSKGTYVRSLARDIGSRLGVGGTLEFLRRTYSAPFSLEQAYLLEDLLEREGLGGVMLEDLFATKSQF